MSIDNELLLDAEDDAREVAFIINHLPIDLKEKFDEEKVYYFLDTLEEYYAESGLFDAETDENGEFELDLEKIATYLAQQAKKDKMGDFTAEELVFFVDAELEYAESLFEE